MFPMSQCATFSIGKETGAIRTMRRCCELELVCDGSSCKYVSGIEPVVAEDPQDATQNAELSNLIAQSVRATIAAAVSK